MENLTVASVFFLKKGAHLSSMRYLTDYASRTNRDMNFMSAFLVVAVGG